MNFLELSYRYHFDDSSYFSVAIHDYSRYFTRYCLIILALFRSESLIYQRYPDIYSATNRRFLQKIN